MSDPINPDHYKGSIECIDALEAALSPEEFRGHLRATVMTYLWRMGKKGPAAVDAEKAQWYLDRLVKSLKSRDDTQAKRLDGTKHDRPRPAG